MPFRRYPRRYYPYRRRFRRFRRRRKRDVFDMARSAWSGVKYIKGLVNSEVLKHDVGSVTPPSTIGVVMPVISIAQGDSDSGRTGNSILAKWLSVRYKLSIHASATNTHFRILVVKDKQQIGDAPPSLSDVLDLATTQVIAPMNPDTAGRFTKLYDQTLTLNASNQTSVVRKINLKLGSQGTHVRYNGSATTDIQRNGLYIIYMTDEGTNTPSIDIYARLGYHDN